jgi:hypothetical protein
MSYPVPDTYNLSRSFRYGDEVVYIFTDGEHYIFAEGIVFNENIMDAKIDWSTVSEPVKIGNSPI